MNRRIALVAVCVACTGPNPPLAPNLPERPAAPDDAAIIEQARAIMSTVDHRDPDALRASVGPDFAFLEYGRELTPDAFETLWERNPDIEVYDFGRDRWDLVTMFYAGPFPHWVGLAKPSIKKGGMIVVESFHDAGPDDSDGGGHFKTGELAAFFAGDPDWEIVTDEVVDGVSDWHSMDTKLVRFIARRR